MLANICTASAQYHTTVVQSTDKSVTLRSIGYGKKAAAAANNAEISAVETILFAGAPGSRFASPLIQEDKATIENKYRKFFTAFYDHAYKDYVETSVVVTAFGKNDLKQKCITMDVCIRVTQLRAFLENNGIIRKFGL